MVDSTPVRRWTPVFIILFVLVLVVSVGLAVIRSTRSAEGERSASREGMEPRTMERQTMERPDPVGNGGDGESSMPRRDGPAERPDPDPDPDPGRQRALITPIRGAEVSEDVWDVAQAIRSGGTTGDGDAARPRFGPTGEEITAVPRTGISPVVVTVADYFLGGTDAEPPTIPVDDTYGDFIRSRLIEAGEAVGGAKEAYRTKAEGERLLLLGHDGQWWEVMVTVNGGRLSDLEYSALTEEG